MLDLPLRQKKPRHFGITSLHDVSLNLAQSEDILKDFASYIDIVKLGVGTGYVMPRIKEKIKLFQSFDIKVYFGGTLFEKFYYQDKIDEYKKYLKSMNVNMVEISCGTLNISLDKRIELVKQFSEEFTVLAEVGSKDNEIIMAPSEWCKEIEKLLNAGSQYVITEGRNSGTAGVYRPSGEIRSGLIADIIKEFNIENLIFEAPTPKSQMYFLNMMGVNVNLGNVNPSDVLLLETQRLGIRSETFYLK